MIQSPETKSPKKSNAQKTLAAHDGPPEAENFYKQANALLGQGKHPEAIAAFDQAIALHPTYMRAIQGQAVLYVQMHQHDKAQNNFQRLMEIDPSYAHAYGILGKMHLTRGYIEKAKQTLEEGLALDPHDPEILSGLAWYYNSSGDKSKAREYYIKAYESDKSLNYLTDLAQQAYSFKDKDDPYLQDMLKLEAQIDIIPKQKHDLLYAAIAKAYRDIKDWDTTFAYTNKMAAAARETIQYNSAAMLNHIALIREYFSASLLQACTLPGCSSEQPVFIIGMPRSGSTLVEQILDAHEDIGSIGESDSLGGLVVKRSYLPEINGKPYMFERTVKELADVLLPKALGQEYVAQLAARGQNKPRVLDKTLNNFLWAGMIHLCLPKAKIIHCHRHPLDTALSCYERLFFQKSIKYSYNLTELGQYYNAYTQLMAHWHRVLPGKILDVRYEDVVEDTEGQARRMLEHLGLPWDDNCLKFHEKKKFIVTASLSQANQPIYKSSVARWKRYEKHLAPLIKAMGKSVPKDALYVLEKYR